MAVLDIAERRLPQDGRINLVVRGNSIDIRVSTLPTTLGESVVLRILDRSAINLDFSALGFSTEARRDYIGALEQPHGILLVTGPTGSGKTTTLYTSLLYINSADKNMSSVEDPVEYRLDGINQTQVKPDIGLDFAQVLRALLRHDPDVMMVGEIRDGETANVAVQAALTGHLVLSTLHTNSAAGTLARLSDMGVENYLITSTLIGVLSQRLVRRLCQACREPYAISSELDHSLNLNETNTPNERNFFHPRGCSKCRDSGYAGRTAIFETLILNDHMRNLILSKASASELHKAAVADGMTSLYRDGLARAFAGETSLEEVLKVARPE